MKLLYAAILLLFFSVSPSVLGADPAPALHWYQITILAGNSKELFTGSSRFDVTEMGTRITKLDEPIMLENLRDSGFFVDAKEFEWRPLKKFTSVHILPRLVLYFTELPKDPLVTQSEQRNPEAGR